MKAPSTLAFLCLVFLGAAWAADQYEVVAERNVQAKVRDGVILRLIFTVRKLPRGPLVDFAAELFNQAGLFHGFPPPRERRASRFQRQSL